MKMHHTHDVPLAVDAVTVDHFVADMRSRQFVFMPSRELWPASSVDARVSPVKVGDRLIPASRWLAKHRPVEQLTWAPGQPEIIRGKLISDGGWIEHHGATVLNLYRGPTIELGDPAKADIWLRHVRLVYPGDHEHIIKFLAHRRQFPGEKINHALVLGGKQGIGKDTILEPVKRAVGPWNCAEVSPKQMLGRFNGYAKSVILRISEARDLGPSDRFAFYDHLKVYAASPPDVIRVDEKNIREYAVPNVCGVIITTNHKSDGIHLSPDDRRHHVAWSEAEKEDFSEDYWRVIHSWYDSGGAEHVTAYLDTLDLSDFNAKAPPPKTEAFWAIVDASRAPEDAELADLLDSLNRPDAVPLSRLVSAAHGAHVAIGEFMKDRRNRRAIPHRLDDCGYSPIRNSDAKDGLWKINGRREAMYGKKELTERNRFAAARLIVNGHDWSSDE